MNFRLGSVNINLMKLFHSLQTEDNVYWAVTQSRNSQSLEKM